MPITISILLSLSSSAKLIRPEKRLVIGWYWFRTAFFRPKANDRMPRPLLSDPAFPTELSRSTLRRRRSTQTRTEDAKAIPQIPKAHCTPRLPKPKSQRTSTLEDEWIASVLCIASVFPFGNGSETSGLVIGFDPNADLSTAYYELFYHACLSVSRDGFIKGI